MTQLDADGSTLTHGAVRIGTGIWAMDRSFDLYYLVRTENVVIMFSLFIWEEKAAGALFSELER